MLLVPNDLEELNLTRHSRTRGAENKKHRIGPLGYRVAYLTVRNVVSYTKIEHDLAQHSRSEVFNPCVACYQGRRRLLSREQG